MSRWGIEKNTSRVSSGLAKACQYPSPPSHTRPRIPVTPAGCDPTIGQARSWTNLITFSSSINALPTATKFVNFMSSA